MMAMPQQFCSGKGHARGHDYEEGSTSSSFFFQQLVLSDHTAKNTIDPKGDRIVRRQDCSRHLKIKKKHMFLLTCLVIIVYLYLTIIAVKRQQTNEDLEVVRSRNDLILLELKQTRVIEGENRDIIPSGNKYHKFPSPRQEKQQTSSLERPEEVKSAEAKMVKLSTSENVPRLTNDPTSEHVLHQISNINQIKKSYQENYSMPPSFKNIASFPSERRSGDIPVVSQGST
jgi:hypothetical protein